MIDALVVDDSALVRQMLTTILTRAGMTVRVAGDPIVAATKIAQKKPDVIVLDLELPRMHGLEFLAQTATPEGIPVVVCSTLAGSGSHAAMRALELGAVDLIEKPKLGVRDFLEDSSIVIRDAVAAAAASRRVRGIRPVRALPTQLEKTTDKVIGIGASTGGTEALRHILCSMPADAPGIIVVQHMPAGFTAAFARRLDSECAIQVKEAEEGERLSPGKALIAPGDRHVEVVRSGARYDVKLRGGALVSRHRPSVDVLFHSLASAAGGNAVGVLLTGMGCDGADGLLAMRNAGAETLAQDEATSVVFGMPREAIARGAAAYVVPLGGVVRTVLSLSGGR